MRSCSEQRGCGGRKRREAKRIYTIVYVDYSNLSSNTSTVYPYSYADQIRTNKDFSVLVMYIYSTFGAN